MLANGRPPGLARYTHVSPQHAATPTSRRLLRLRCSSNNLQWQLPERTSANKSASSSSPDPDSCKESISLPSSQSNQQPKQRWLRLPWFDSNTPPTQHNTWRTVRNKVYEYLKLGSYSVVLAIVLIVFRQAATLQSRRAPKEVLYSDFVTLIQSGRVRSARLEAGTSHLYFDLTPTAPTSLQSTDASSSSPPTSSSTQEAATTTSTSSSGTSSAAPAKPRATSSKQYYVKVADKNDPFLVSQILAAGVQFGVIRASVTTSLINSMLTALAMWLPLTPLLFFLKSIVDARSGVGKKKKAITNVPNVTFNDVAGGNRVVVNISLTAVCPCG